MMIQFLQWALLLLSYFPTSEGVRRSHSSICFFDEKYLCKKIAKHALEKFQVPPNACIIRPCQHCITVQQTFILHNNELIEPQAFILRPLNITTTKQTTAYFCADGEKPCLADNDLYTGDEDFCKQHSCSPNAACRCAYLKKSMELLHISDVVITNPPRLQLEVCLFDKRTHNQSYSLHRRLLEHESATFHFRNLTFSFNDPVLTLPDLGKVIIRTEDYQTVYTVPDDLTIVLPFELLAYKSTMSVTYLHKNGQTVEGIIHLTGKTICQQKTCYLCMDIWKHMKCYPAFVSYIVYSILIFSVLFFFWFLKTVLKTILYVFQLFIFILYALFKIVKLLARISLLLGSYLGTLFYNIFASVYAFLENHRAQGARFQLHQIVLFALFLHICTVHADCNTQALVHSELRTCESLDDGTKKCHLFSTAEVTLPAISSETCLLFMDKNEQHLFTLKIRLDAVICSFHTKRLYYTFPVTARHISQVSCIFNEYCGRGIHCIKDQVGKHGLNFEAETPESRDYPGKSACLPGGLGVGCTILTRAACNFYRTWYVPDLLHSYEVSQITGHTCSYQVSVTHLQNNTISRVVLTDSAYTDTGVKVTVLGAYDQPQIHLSDALIQRVGRPSESYLAPACTRNAPKAGEIGAIQANQSFTKDFIFDPDMTTCDFFEDRLRCNTVQDPLLQLSKSQEFLLPTERDMHLFQIRDGNLISSMLVSSAVRLQLQFHDFKINTKSVTVCPQIDDSQFDIAGCYQCPILARLTFKAHSTCQPGTVMISFQEINVHSKAVYLSIDPMSHVIKFVADKKCYVEKMCLKAQSLVQCRQLDFCLEEPSIELLSLSPNYTTRASASTNNKWWDWINLPSMGSSLFLLKFLGSSLFIICLLITTLSTVITCCCRQR